MAGRASIAPMTTARLRQKIPTGRHRRSNDFDPSPLVSRPRSPAANRGTSGSGANLVAIERPSSAARFTGDAKTTSAQTRRAATSASLEFDCNA